MKPSDEQVAQYKAEREETALRSALADLNQARHERWQEREANKAMLAQLIEMAGQINSLQAQVDAYAAERSTFTPATAEESC